MLLDVGLVAVAFGALCAVFLLLGLVADFIHARTFKG
jgi:energy-converting hydrogenase Eha subunit C